MKKNRKISFFNQFSLDCTNRFYASYSDWRFFVVPHYCRDLIDEENKTRVSYLEISQSHANTLQRIKAFLNAEELKESIIEGDPNYVFSLSSKASPPEGAEKIPNTQNSYYFATSNPLLDLYRESLQRLAAFQSYKPNKALCKIFGLKEISEDIFLIQLNAKQSFLALKASIDYHSCLLDQALQISIEDISALIEQTILQTHQDTSQKGLADWQINHNILHLTFHHRKD